MFGSGSYFKVKFVFCLIGNIIKMVVKIVDCNKVLKDF